MVPNLIDTRFWIWLLKHV